MARSRVTVDLVEGARLVSRAFGALLCAAAEGEVRVGGDVWTMSCRRTLHRRTCATTSRRSMSPNTTQAGQCHVKSPFSCFWPLTSLKPGVGGGQGFGWASAALVDQVARDAGRQRGTHACGRRRSRARTRTDAPRAGGRSRRTCSGTPSDRSRRQRDRELSGSEGEEQQISAAPPARSRALGEGRTRRVLDRGVVVL